MAIENGGPPIQFWLGISEGGLIVQVNDAGANPIDPAPSGPEGTVVGAHAIGPEFRVQGLAQDPGCWIQNYQGQWFKVC
jgi:hypothetical protein